MSVANKKREYIYRSAMPELLRFQFGFPVKLTQMLMPQQIFCHFIQRNKKLAKSSEAR